MALPRVFAFIAHHQPADQDYNPKDDQTLNHV